MAESDVPVTNQPEVQIKQERLKYLEFVQVAVLHAVLYASKVYGYAKENSGLLKPGVETIEGTIKSVAGPAYHKFHDVPVEVLKFVDRKVDKTVTKLDSQVAPFVKQLSTKTKNMSTLASEVKNADLVELAIAAYTKLEPTAKGLYTKYEPAAKGLYTQYEPTAKGLYTKYEPTAKVLYTKYEPVAEQYAVSAWQSLNQLPYFSKVANVVVPKAAYYSEMYNQTVQQTAELGFKIILEFAQGVEDKHLGILKNKFSDSLQYLEHLNLNVCQKVSDNGIEAITAASPSLRKISIYWNVRVTDVGISHPVKKCKHIVDLNLSGCKGISDKGLQMVADNYQHLESLDITRSWIMQVHQDNGRGFATCSVQMLWSQKCKSICTFKVRENAILLNLGSLRAIAMLESVFIFNYNRKRLFSMINDLPTIFEVVSGIVKKQPKEKSSHSSNKSKSNTKGMYLIPLECFLDIYMQFVRMNVTFYAGNVVCSWGWGEDGQLGHGDAEDRSSPTQLSALDGQEIVSLTCGADHTIAFSESQLQVYSWAWGDFWRLGHGNSTNCFIPQPIKALQGLRIRQIACGDSHCLAVTMERELLRGITVKMVVAGAEHTAAITEDGDLYGWGWGRYGNLGLGDRKDLNIPEKVSIISGEKMVQVACGWRHTISISSSGDLYTYGWSKYGQLGHGDFRDHLVPCKLVK
ncbi:Regulator of chromosome condensation 1/beta-lactamase-inhibitor protein II [Artemisia annua]|uniref:Regulator of chromosome condensation 1/beta-lactamase-inhibitor protein II n=1 Tax=Artemisia annua TaxID=35608 RepID=A0A2U1PMT1_ARTAN|nr:Regulator of chromosome condensation 1/beta-lactamase-inhibitor protein II [Artemisia annua]